jgi:hypothetical protein
MSKPIRVLVACEFSGTVRDAFLALGHDAMSCDLLPSETPGPHYQGDVRDLLVENRWDLVIAHPPCTYLCSSGMHWTTRGLRDPQLTEDAVRFFLEFTRMQDCAWAIENPIGRMSTLFRKPDQIIQPYQFGHDASKATCLWTHKLPTLLPTDYIDGRLVCCGRELSNAVGKYGCPNCEGKKTARRRWGNQTTGGQNNVAPGPSRWMERSRTYVGIARAMADQWGNHVAIQITGDDQ